MFSRPRCGLSALIVSLLLTLYGSFVGAQESATPRATSMAEALEQTTQQGRPCLLVLTSAENSQSRSALIEIASAVDAEGLLVTVAEWSVDRDPKFDPATLPRLALFYKSDKGLALAGQKTTDIQVSSTLGWVRSLGIGTQNRKVDAALNRTQYATPQAPPAAPQAFAAPPPVMMAPQQAVLPVPAASAYGVSVPSASIVVSPSAASIYVTAAPAPNVFIAQPVQSPSQLFVGSPMSLPPSPVTPVGIMAASYAVAPQQAVAQASSGVMILHSPGLLESLVGTIGEHLARRKWPRVQMGSAPTLTTIPQNMAYAAGPQSIPMSPQPVAVSPPAPSPPPTPLASPQSDQVPQARHGWFHKRP